VASNVGAGLLLQSAPVHFANNRSLANGTVDNDKTCC